MDHTLYCGAAKAVITPSPALLPYVFGLMGQQYGKVRDDLHLRVLALKSGDTAALLVVYDLDKATNPQEWVPLLAERTGVPEENILYTAIHTHTAPLTGYRPFEGPNFIERKPPEVQAKVKEYEAFLLEKLLAAADEAMAALTPARFGYATAPCYIGMNRNRLYRTKNPDGTVTESVSLGNNPEGPVDHTQLAVRFERAEDGAPIAFFLNYAVHCVAGFLNDGGGDGRAFLSADIAGAVETALEAEYPGAVALWTSAPAGDVNPVSMIQTNYPDPATGAPTEHLIRGEDAADALIGSLAGAELAAVRQALDKVSCTVTEAPLAGAIDWAVTKCARGIGAAEAYPDDYTIRTHLVKIGPLALIGIDGELFTSLGWAMKAASPCPDTFIVNHDASLLLNNPGYIYDDETQARIAACVGAGGTPGRGVSTPPGAVKAALEASTRKLFAEV